MNPYTSEPPPGPLLPVGTILTTHLGPRRIIYCGDMLYVQRERRRYWCCVESRRDTPHRTRHGHLVRRLQLTVRIMEHA